MPYIAKQNGVITEIFAGMQKHRKDVEFLAEDSQEWQEYEAQQKLSKSIQTKISEINEGYENSFINGLDSSLTDSEGDLIKVHVKKDDQNNYAGWLVTVQDELDTDTLDIPLIDFNGNIHQITKADLKQLCWDVMNYKAQQEAKRATLFAQLNAATNLAEIETISWEA
jgi:RNA-binding protein YhbY